MRRLTRREQLLRVRYSSIGIVVLTGLLIGAAATGWWRTAAGLLAVTLLLGAHAFETMRVISAEDEGRFG